MRVSDGRTGKLYGRAREQEDGISDGAGPLNGQEGNVVVNKAATSPMQPAGHGSTDESTSRAHLRFARLVT